MANDPKSRLRDEFFLAAEVRPATVDHYMAWLARFFEASPYNKARLSLEPFPADRFFTASRSAYVPEIDEQNRISLITPPDVRLERYDTSYSVYSCQNGQHSGREEVLIWKEMLDGMINDGFALSRIVPEAQLASSARTAILSALKGGPAGSDSLYEELSDGATFQGILEMKERLKNIDATGLVRAVFDLQPGTPVDAAAQAVIESQKAEAARTLKVLRYKLDPESRRPIPAFGSRAKIQVGPVIRLKDPGAP